MQHNKQHHRKALLSSFPLIANTLGFHSQTQKQKYLVQLNNSTERRSTEKQLIKPFTDFNQMGFHLQLNSFSLRAEQTILRKSAAQYLFSFHLNGHNLR